MKFLFLMFLSVTISSQLYAVQECKNLPKNSIVRIKAPIDKWVQIKCLNSKGLVVVVPATGMKWLSSAKKPVMLVSGDMAISTDLSEESDSEAPKEWKTFFVKQNVKRFKGMSIVSANMMLFKETKTVAKFGRIYQLSLLANNKRVHNIIFYATHEFPVWVMVCNDKCKTREVYRVKR